MTTALLVMLVSQVPFFINFFVSLFKGEKAGNNPWKATTLEWLTPSPAPHGNFTKFPEVHRGPYEYGNPGRATDYWPQNEPT